MGTKRNPGQFDCYLKAERDEPIFTLRAKDPASPALVRSWANDRIRRIDAGDYPLADHVKVEEALACADAMEGWYLAHTQHQQDNGVLPLSVAQQGLNMEAATMHPDAMVSHLRALSRHAYASTMAGGGSLPTGAPFVSLGELMNETQKTASLLLIRNDIHGRNRAAGWWSDLHTGAPVARDLRETCMLKVSELAEAMEGHRKSLPDDKLPTRPMLEVELGDTVIRLFDNAGGFGWDLAHDFRSTGLPLDNVPAALLHIVGNVFYIAHDVHQSQVYAAAAIANVFALGEFLRLDVPGAIVEKLAYNATRADHKPENRKAAGGKAY